MNDLRSVLLMTLFRGLGSTVSIRLVYFFLPNSCPAKVYIINRKHPTSAL